MALGYKADYIKKYFYDYRYTSVDFTLKLDPNVKPIVHSKSDEKEWEIVCVDTGVDTLKGGRIKRLEPYIQSDHFHLTYGDGLSDIDLVSLDKFHQEHQKIATVTAVRPPSRFGEMTIKGDLVTEFVEKPQLNSGHINGGFFVFNKTFLKSLSIDKNCDLEFGALQKLAHDQELMTYRHEGYWQCMDNIRDFEYLNKLWNSGEAPWKKWETT